MLWDSYSIKRDMDTTEMRSAVSEYCPDRSEESRRSVTNPSLSHRHTHSAVLAHSNSSSTTDNDMRRVRFDISSSSSSQGGHAINTSNIPEIRSVRPRKRDQPWKKTNDTPCKEEDDLHVFYKPAVVTRQTPRNLDLNPPKQHTSHKHVNTLDPFEPFTESDVPWWNSNRPSILKRESDDSLSPTSVLSLNSDASSSIVWAAASSTPATSTRIYMNNFKALSASLSSDAPFDECDGLTKGCDGNPSPTSIALRNQTSPESKSVLQDIQWSHHSTSTTPVPDTTSTTSPNRTQKDIIKNKDTSLKTPIVQSKQIPLDPHHLLHHKPSQNPEMSFEQVVMSTLQDLNILSKAKAPSPSSTPSIPTITHVSQSKPTESKIQTTRTTKSILSTSISNATRIRPRFNVRFSDDVQIGSPRMEEQEEEENYRAVSCIKHLSPGQQSGDKTRIPSKQILSHHKSEQEMCIPHSHPLSSEEEFYRLVAAIVIQAFVRRHAAYKEAWKRYKAIFLIQSFYRTHVQTKLSIQKHPFHQVAATRIQALVRGWIARECLLICGYCAAVIQKAYRNYNRRCAFKSAMRKLRSNPQQKQQRQIIPDSSVTAQEESIEIRLLIAKWKKCHAGDGRR